MVYRGELLMKDRGETDQMVCKFIGVISEENPALLVKFSESLNGVRHHLGHCESCRQVVQVTRDSISS